jgi:hypothetical protein
MTKHLLTLFLKKGAYPLSFVAACSAHFGFAPLVGIRISGPTYHVRVIGENPQQSENARTLYVHELNDEAVFPGEIELPEKTTTGISKALYGLELWADFLCLAVGNPKIIVEVQRPITAVITARSSFDPPALDRWSTLFQNYFQLEINERKKLVGAIWWYRKACATAYYSIFDSYTAYWNCLEILCAVSGKINKGPKVDEAVQKHLKSKSAITAGDIDQCYKNFVNYSIKEQMKDALRVMMGEEQAVQTIYQCFEIKPDEDRLYRIRNDINHGNIRENSGQAYERVYYRGMLLQDIVMTLIHGKLGHPISLGMSVNALAEKFADPTFRKGEA